MKQSLLKPSISAKANICVANVTPQPKPSTCTGNASMILNNYQPSVSAQTKNQYEFLRQNRRLARGLPI